MKRNKKLFLQISLDKLSRIAVSEKFHWINFRELPFSILSQDKLSQKFIRLKYLVLVDELLGWPRKNLKYQ